MIIASNFKTNHTRTSTNEYIEFVEEFIKKENISSDVYVFPPSTALMNSRSVFVGAQNAYPVQSGSFTGEIALEQLQEFGIKSILIGHSERRHVLKESQEFINSKFEFFKNSEFMITYCIGEPLEIRQKGLKEVLEYISLQLESIDMSYENLIVAYEPVWAIGTGVSATMEDIKSTHSALKNIYGFKNLLYGGSVNLDNVASIVDIEGVDGVLIGTASWKKEHFCEILKKTNKLGGR
ncbi:MAG: triosephosphate isomerase [Campylobacterota bacterium]|nr:triosephosphate isomerase [Campylobacterota bacterium]